MTWVIQSVLGLFKGSWNYVASSGSSTTEGASDVSLSHLFHLSPSTCRLFLFVFCCCVVWWVGFLSCVFLRVLQSAGGCFDLYPRVLDDRQCFIARSAMRKKKRLFAPGKTSNTTQLVIKLTPLPPLGLLLGPPSPLIATFLSLLTRQNHMVFAFFNPACSES